MTDDADVIIVGGGHNGLVAAAYLARSDRKVVVMEARHQLGGAVSGEQNFPGMAVQLSRFSYLVSLLPDLIINDLGLDLDLRSRRIASYTPIGASGLLVERDAGPLTRASFAQLTGSDDEYARWEKLASWLQSVASTLTGPLPRAADIRNQLSPELWTALVERPVGELLEDALVDDTVRGVVATDALIGTFASLADPIRRQNRCFLYHVIGNGTGEWKVPVGGMGRVVSELSDAARRVGATLSTHTRVTGIEPDERGGGKVMLADGNRYRAPFILANCAPTVLQSLLGYQPSTPEGSQIKIN